MSVHNGLSDLPSLTQSSLRDAVAETVAALRGSRSDQDMADEWGVSAGTVNNAQNKRNDLALMSWLRLGKRFGPDGLNTALALLRMRAVTDDTVTIDVARVPSEVAGTLPLLIELLRDGQCCASDVRKLEDAGAIDAILKVADFLRQQREQARLTAVR